MIEIKHIKLQQRNLKRSYQIDQLVKDILLENEIPPIKLILEENGIYCHDGHHRLEAYILAGRTYLRDYEWEQFFNKPKHEYI